MSRIVALSCTLVFASVLASGQELTKEAKIKSILELEYANNANTASLDQINSLLARPMATGTTPEQQAKDKEMRQKILESVKALMDKIRPQIVNLYNEIFSAEEIDGILAFYQSPAGHALLDKRPLIMSKTMALLMPEMQRVSQK